MADPAQNDVASRLGLQDRVRLLAAARDAIVAGPGVDTTSAPSNVPGDVLTDVPCATFVTLRLNGELRGCIGSLTAEHPLLESVRINARKAAFHDPRFHPVSSDEVDALELEISILSAMLAVDASTRDALIKALRPGVDGLLIELGPRRATFLPAVWRSLAAPDAFVDELFRKAGIRPDPWPTDLQAWRYTATEID